MENELPHHVGSHHEGLPIHLFIGTTLCAEHWFCRRSLLDYWAQSWTGHHSATVYQQAGTHSADLGRMTGSQPHLVLIQQPSRI